MEGDFQEVAVVRTVRNLAVKYNLKGGMTSLIKHRDRLFDIQSSREPIKAQKQGAADAKQKAAGLQKWASERLFIDGVEARVEPGKGIGLFATRNIKQFTRIMEVSRSDCVQAKRLPNVLDFAKILDKPVADESERLWNYANVTLYILGEKLKENSDIGPYLSAMPSRYTHPVYFTQDEFALLEGTSVCEASFYILCTALAIYSEYWLLMDADTSYAESFGLNTRNFTLKGFLWAYLASLTRNYNGVVNGGDEVIEPVLIPYWDSMNHDEDQNVGTVNRHSHFALHATRDIECGESLRIHYLDPLDPPTAFSVYGFVRVTCFPLHLKFSDDDPMIVERKAILQRLENSQPHRGVLLCDPELSEDPVNHFNPETLPLLVELSKLTCDDVNDCVLMAVYTLVQDLEGFLDQLESKRGTCLEIFDRSPSENLILILEQITEEQKFIKNLLCFIQEPNYVQRCQEQITSSCGN